MRRYIGIFLYPIRALLSCKTVVSSIKSISLIITNYPENLFIAEGTDDIIYLCSIKSKPYWSAFLSTMLFSETSEPFQYIYPRIAANNENLIQV